MKILTCLGIRPDWINMSLLIPRLEKAFGRENVVVVHSGQHYSYYMDKVFFEELGIRDPDYHLGMPKGLKQGQQTAYVINKIEPILLKEKPDVVISFSDGNPSVFAVSASKNFIKVAHIEAGMRSYDWRMPEEKNRRIVDAITDLFFVPTEIARQNLIWEGVAEDKIHITSKLIIDVIEHFKSKWRRSKILEELDLDSGEYFLATLHRPENVEDPDNLWSIIRGLELVYKRYELPIIAPLHPRTQRAIKRFKIDIFKGLNVMNPLGFFDFTKLENNCLCGITDSGTVEEDLCWFRIPCVTTRMSTERPETVHVGANILVGETDGTFIPERIADGVRKMLSKDTDWEIPYSTGATKRIVRILKENEGWLTKPKTWW